MTDKVRCPACRGSKKVAKLGGVIGDCNNCAGTGFINAADKFVAPVLEELPMDKLIIESVAVVAPIPVSEEKVFLPSRLHEQDEPIVAKESQPKRKVFQRKK